MSTTRMFRKRVGDPRRRTARTRRGLRHDPRKLHPRILRTPDGKKTVSLPSRVLMTGSLWWANRYAELVERRSGDEGPFQKTTLHGYVWGEKRRRFDAGRVSP